MNLKQLERKSAKKIVKENFKNDYSLPFELTDGQADIFNAIFLKNHNRVEVIASTQYGKSDTVAMAILLRSLHKQEDFAVIAGRKDKAQIIMARVLQHVFDNEVFYKQLELDANMPLDRLRKERSKDHIIWRHGGGVRTFSAGTSSRKMLFDSLTGFGSPNIIEDESALINDDYQAMILRMLGGHKDNFLLKIGNPFYRNHFFRTSKSPKYRQIFIDYHQGLKEGRYTQEFIDEMRDEAFFDVLYECKFPSESDFEMDGFRRLIDDELLDNAFVDKVELSEGNYHLGVDVGAGGDRTSFVIRRGKEMKLLSTNRNSDTMSQVSIVDEYVNLYNILDVAVDMGGLGQGLVDRLSEKELPVNGVLFGQSAWDKSRFKNARAEMYFDLFKWLKDGGKIERNPAFEELRYIYYKSDSEGKLQIQPKIDLIKKMNDYGLSISSPDVADGAVLTFAQDITSLNEDDFAFL